ncbi:MAG: helix-turn-helix domain-containing protein [Rikenellaceae bacterium]|nr:helix-turn-helix domain-containing protein [Rikenellaceae bacterium]
MEGKLLLSVCLSFIITVSYAAGAFHSFDEELPYMVSAGLNGTYDKEAVTVADNADGDMSWDMESIEECLENGDYRKAMNLIEAIESLAFARDSVLTWNMKLLYEYKAEAEYGLGNYKSAYDNLSEAYRIDDSIDSIMVAERMDEIMSDISQMDMVIADKEMQVSRQRNLIWGISVAAFLLVAGLLSVIFHYRKIDQVRFGIFRRMEDAMTHNRKMRDYTLERIRRNMNGDDDTLFIRIDDAVRDNELFRSHSVSRRDVAAIVGSNETYVSNSVKEVTGLTFSEYVNMIRLDYACNLMKSDKSLTIDTVSDESGFSSSRTFYRLFKERFGLTPSQYTKAAHK